MNDKQKERYIRWQSIRISQFSFSLNLFLGIAIASLGYVINLKLEGKSQDPVLIPIIYSWSTSALLGCIVTLSRLLDSRYTAEKIKEETVFNSWMAKYCGPFSWGCLWGQIITYVVGAVLFISLVINY